MEIGGSQKCLYERARKAKKHEKERGKTSGTVFKEQGRGKKNRPGKSGLGGTGVVGKRRVVVAQRRKERTRTEPSE